MSNNPKILVLDIETAPFEAYVWDIWEQNVGLNQIKVETSIISYAAKWLGKSRVLYSDTGGRGPGNVRNDKPLLQEIRSLLDETDVVVVQNGQAFDIKRINARLIKHDIPPYSPIKIVDTKLVAKRYFAFTSNKLEWMAGHLTDTPKDDHKEFPGFELWLEVLKDNPRAWAVLKKYNRRDTVSTEKLYLRMLPWIANHPNLAAYSGAGHSCPKCGSLDVQRRGEAVNSTGRYTRFQCINCAGWSRGKALLTPPAARRAQLVSL